MREADVDSSDLYGDDATLGAIMSASDPKYLPGKALMAVVREYEEGQAELARLRKHVSSVDPALRAKVALIPPIPFEEYRALLRRRPGTLASPAFREYETRREELHAAERELFRQLAEADAETQRAHRERRKAAE
ncbi:hypothetical protein C4K88_01060 [Arthrobacter pityocampae]|uniref:Uncharacterized protein n=2 Tax=Arthrobacter pityocampae TaxID=547334 RepID=A0A2S5J106_9MICC|nr:hypothetical protein C4K88_01060 [Arthrobacter pityocampae]